MAEESHKVILNVYDLSQGLARQLSMTLLGKVIEGIWRLVPVTQPRPTVCSPIIATTSAMSPMGALLMPMIQNLETTLRAGAVPQVPQFGQSVSAQPSGANVDSSSDNAERDEVKSEEQPNHAEAKTLEKTTASAKPTGAEEKSTDPLGDARAKVQEEISREFATIMAAGTLRASEAAALATRKVMQRYGHLNAAMPQS
ncbi:hypothetical protein V6N13_137818 [Hibiscus sabdariffa]